MNIRAKTCSGREVTIVGFVCKYNKTYAVIINEGGILTDYPIGDLTAIDF